MIDTYCFFSTECESVLDIGILNIVNIHRFRHNMSKFNGRMCPYYMDGNIFS